MLVSFFFYVYGYHRDLHVLTLSFPTRRSSDLGQTLAPRAALRLGDRAGEDHHRRPGAGAEHRLQVDHQRAGLLAGCARAGAGRSEEHTSELQSLMRISYAVFCLKKKKYNYNIYYM